MSFFTAEFILTQTEKIANGPITGEKIKLALHSCETATVELYDFGKHLNPLEFDEITVGRREFHGRIWTSICAIGDRNGVIGAIGDLKNRSCSEIAEFAFENNALLRYGMEIASVDENRLEMRSKECTEADLEEFAALEQLINNESVRKATASAEFESRIKQNPANKITASDDSKRELHNFLLNLADRHRIQGGHWTIYASSRTENLSSRSFLLNDIPNVWLKLLSSFFFGFLSIKSSMVRSRMSPDGIALATHTGKWDKTINKETQIFDLEKAIRLADIYADMKFKMDIYSACGIVHGDRANRLGLRPTLYCSSVRQDPKNQDHKYSEIRTDYTQDYKPVNDFFSRGHGCDHYQNIWAVGVEQWAQEMEWDMEIPVL